MGSIGEGWDQLALEGFMAEAQTLTGLVGVSIEDWVVLQNEKFDLKLDNEPHIAQTLYLEKATGRYLHKIFGQIIQDGQLDTPSGLKDLTQEIFEHARVCQGFDDGVKVEPGIVLVPGFHPYSRKVDPNCLKVFKDPSLQTTLCPNCYQAMHLDLDPLSGFCSVQYKTEESSNEALLMDIASQGPSLWPEGSKGTATRDLKEDDNRNDPHSEDDDKPVPEKRRKLEELLDPASGELSIGDVDKDKLSPKRKARNRKVHCDHCDKTFSQDSYQKHCVRLRRIIVPCKVCQLSCYSFPSLAKHMDKKHNMALESLEKYLQTPEEIKSMKKGQKCSICDMYVNGTIMVHRHRALNHELGDFKCAECNQYQLTYYHLVMHNYNKHDSALPMLEPTANDLEQVEHEDGSTELVRKRHVCPKCKKGFKYDGDWGSHMRYHHSWSVFNCQSCNEMCHYATDFVAHVRNFHSDNPEIKCPKCLEILSLKEDPNCFEAHFTECAKKAIVGDVKDGNEKQPKKTKGTPFQCEKCGKNYFSKYLLRCHLDSHEGVERFQCEKCEYKTNVKSVMQDHQNFHLRAEGKTHDEAGLNLFFYCDQCPKKVSTKNSLNRHIKHIHEGVKRSLKCQDCDKSFGSESILYAHKRKAHGFVAKWVRRGKRDGAL